MKCSAAGRESRCFISVVTRASRPCWISEREPLGFQPGVSLRFTHGRDARVTIRISGLYRAGSKPYFAVDHIVGSLSSVIVPMKRHVFTFARYFTPAISVAIFVASGWLWHRSMTCADHFYRVEPAPGGCAMRGFGAYHGAVMFGSIFDSASVRSPGEYHHQCYFVGSTGTGGTSMLKPRPAFVVGGLGFGMSRGELSVSMPLAFLFVPPRTYHIVYLPYYFIMLITAIAPARLGVLLWRFYRRRRAVHHAEQVSTVDLISH